MPVSSSVNSTITVQDVVNSMRAYPELTPILGVSGWEQEPALTIGNDVMQKMLAQTFNWKWNRANAPSFLTNALQQDYVSTVTDMGWLESAWRVDINNTALPQPIFSLETAKDLGPTAYQANPFFMSWTYNALAQMGKWKANTSYPTGLGAAQTPTTPIQQFIDGNGNILYVTINGISGNSAPLAGVNAAAGTTVTDNTVTWTVADPNAVAFRLAPLPATSGIVWQMNPVYQKKPPKLTALQNTLSPIPDQFAYLFRSGFQAMCYEHAGSSRFREAIALWEEALYTALRSSDRERDETTFYPSEGLTSGGFERWGQPIGPAWPFTVWS